MPYTRRGASTAPRGGRNAQAGPSQALDGDAAGPSQANQETGSTADTLETADFPDKTTDKEFIVIRSKYNSAKMTATAAMTEVREKAVCMQEKVDGGTAVSVLKRSAMRLQASMDEAEEAVSEQLLLGTKLISFSSYLAVALADTDPTQATQANSIQLAVVGELKQLKRDVERVYRSTPNSSTWQRRQCLKPAVSVLPGRLPLT